MPEAQPPPLPRRPEDTATLPTHLPAQAGVGAEEAPAADLNRPCPCCGRDLIEDQLPENILTDAPEGIANTVLVCSDVTGCGFYEY